MSKPSLSFNRLQILLEHSFTNKAQQRIVVTSVLMTYVL